MQNNELVCVRGTVYARLRKRVYGFGILAKASVLGWGVGLLSPGNLSPRFVISARLWVPTSASFLAVINQS